MFLCGLHGRIYNVEMSKPGCITKDKFTFGRWPGKQGLVSIQTSSKTCFSCFLFSSSIDLTLPICQCPLCTSSLALRPSQLFFAPGDNAKLAIITKKCQSKVINESHSILFYHYIVDQFNAMTQAMNIQQKNLYMSYPVLLLNLK